MHAKLIQRQIPLDSKVKFVLKSGQEVSGTLVEIGRGHVTVDQNGKFFTLIIEMIGAWEVNDEQLLSYYGIASEESDISASLSVPEESPLRSEAVNNDKLDEQQEELILPDTQIEKSEAIIAIPHIPTDKAGTIIASSSIEETASSTGLLESPISTVIAPNPVAPTNFPDKFAVLTKLEEIETRFVLELQKARITDIKPPEFELEDTLSFGKRKNEAVSIWNRVKDKYNYAAKINELDQKFNRVQAFTQELKQLADSFPNHSGLNRHLAYFYWLSGNELEAIECYKHAVKYNHKSDDWYNLAVLALKNEQNALTCYSLEQFFRYSTEIKGTVAWYVYLKLINTLSNQSTLADWLEAVQRNFSPDETVLLFETSIYLLMVCGLAENAETITQQWLAEGTLSKAHIVNALRHLDNTPNEAYQNTIASLTPSNLDQQKPGRLRGIIYAYRSDLDFGFLRDESGIEYFFDRNEILEYSLFDKVVTLRPQEEIPIFFEATEGPKGPRALQLSLTIDETADQQVKDTSFKLQGHIYVYKSDRNYGFLRALDGQEYFFHRSAVVEDELLEEIEEQEWGLELPVIFETAKGARGANPVAVSVTRFRNVNEIFDLALQFAEEGEYHKAIAQVKQVLAYDPANLEVQEVYEKWRGFARLRGVPQGSNLFARAKRADLIEQDLERAVELYLEAIKRGDNVESAIKDRAALLDRLGRPEEAIEFLINNRGKIHDRQSYNNLLLNLYPKAGRYDQAITLLKDQLSNTRSNNKKAEILRKIAQIYLSQENYKQAEENFRKILKLQPSNKAVERNLAICLFKQERLSDAEIILNRLLPDTQATALLEAIKQAKITGLSSELDQIIIETTLSDSSSEISQFTKFFIDNCRFEGIPPNRAQTQKFRQTDISDLVNLATQLGISRPGDRAGYYLSAAKIVSILEGGNLSEHFFTYLGRSFVSRADATLSENRPLDVARELYCEALTVYDGNREGVKGEQDAVNTLVRYLYSTLGQSQIPRKVRLSPLSSDDIEKIIQFQTHPNKVFDAIAYLVFRSRYAANRVLKLLFEKEAPLRELAISYLESKGVMVSKPIKSLNDFVSLWNELLKKNLREKRAISNELLLLRQIELTTASIEDRIERIKGFNERLFFDVDRQRTSHLQQVFETILELCKQVRFEEQDRLCIQVSNSCQDLFREIEENPTKFSIEELHPTILKVQEKIVSWQEELYEKAVPQLSLRLALESYTLANNHQIEVQIAVENWIGRSSAESLELVVQEDDTVFELTKPEIKLDSSLRGGDRKILKIPIRITQRALDSKTFSLPLYAQYRTRAGETVTTPVVSFSIRLYSESDFEEVENPYAAYAEGGVVDSPEMFYGRQELIENAVKSIKESRKHSKSIVIFGQKRAGKSSILFHLKNQLVADSNILVLDLGNVGSILDEHSASPLLYQILWTILNKLEYAIEDKVDIGYSPLNLTFPKANEFYNHPSPLVEFKHIFDDFKRSASKTTDWKEAYTVLLIDEFSYIHEWIVSDRISGTFMKNWKALLQENYFSAVLVGQDVMPKFKQLFPNEFGTTQDERVSYLTKDAAIKLIDEPIRIGGREGQSRYREQSIERLVNLTAGSPFYIQIICNRIVEYMNRRRAPFVTEADVEQIKNELINGVNALGLDKFDNLISSGDTSKDAISNEDALKLLTAIALNSQTGPCNRSSLTCETYTPIDTILDDLTRREIIERERGQYYRIRVGLFNEWLIANQ